MRICFELLFYMLPGIYIHVLIPNIIQKSLKPLTKNVVVVYNEDPIIVNIIHSSFIPLLAGVPHSSAVGHPSVLGATIYLSRLSPDELLFLNKKFQTIPWIFFKYF